MVKVGDIIGIWKINKILCMNDNFVIICDVSTYKIDVNELLNKLNGVSNWIMKLRLYEKKYSEVDIIKKINFKDVPNSVIADIDSEYMFGFYDKYEWYIIEKCDGDLNKYIKIATEKWDILLENVCSFLKYLHRVKKVIHGDLKEKNILYNSELDKFKVCDYESCKKQVLDISCNKIIETIKDGLPIYNRVDSDGYYFYYLGANLNESYMSYKMDLLSFGFILWNIYSYKTTKRSLFKWQLRAIELYESNEQIYRYDELEKLKSEEEMPDIIKEYFKIVDTIDPLSIEPPDKNIYDRIFDLKKYKL